MKNTTILFFLSFFLVFTSFSCNKKDPTPETSDEVYKDIKQEIDIARKNLEVEEAQNNKVKEEASRVIPQTGQIKMAQKRVSESNANLETYKQQLKYFEIKLEQRKAYVRDRYSESFKPNGRTWPDPEEAKEYKVRLKLQRDALNWGKPNNDPKPADKKKKDVPRGTNEHGNGESPAPPSSGH